MIRMERDCLSMNLAMNISSVPLFGFQSLVDVWWLVFSFQILFGILKRRKLIKQGHKSRSALKVRQLKP